MWAKSLLLAIALCAASALPGAGGASNAQTLQPNWVIQAQGRTPDRGGQILSLREIVDIVQARYGGELLSARLEQGARPVYVLRWRLPNNDVTDLRVDAASGQFR